MTNISLVPVRLHAGLIILDQTVMDVFDLYCLGNLNYMYQSGFFENLVTKHKQNTLTVDKATSLKEGDLITSTFVDTSTFVNTFVESTVTTTVKRVIKIDHVPGESTSECWLVKGEQTVISVKKVERSDS